MRNDFIETAEIADSELDNVAGGIGLGGGVKAGLGVHVDGVQGAVSNVTGLVGGVLPSATSVTDLSPALNTVSGLTNGLGLGL